MLLKNAWVVLVLGTSLRSLEINVVAIKIPLYGEVEWTLLMVVVSSDFSREGASPGASIALVIIDKRCDADAFHPKQVISTGLSPCSGTPKRLLTNTTV